MANNIIKRVWNQNKMVSIEALQGMIFQAEDGGHTFEISGVDDSGNPVALSGTVAGVFVRPDNADIALSGTASNGKVYVNLSDACYAVTGKFGLTIFVTADGKKTAVYAAIGTVNRTSGGAVAGDTPQDVVDLINAISAAVATIPASYTNLMASVAPTYSNSALYAAGSYVWYDGKLYRCTTAITTAESWTAAHWTAAVLGNDVFDLKSALSQYTFLFFTNRIDIDTTNHTVTIGTGYIMRPQPGNFIEISSPTTVSYTVGNVGMIVCEFTGNTIKYITTQDIGSTGFALLLISETGTKFFSPYSYTNIYVDGSLISYSNMLSALAPYVSENDIDIDNLMSVLNYQEQHITNTGTVHLDTNAIFVDVYNVLGKGKFLKSISFPQSETLNMDISLWKKTRNKIIRYRNQNYSVVPVNNVCTVVFNLYLEEDTVIGYNCKNTVFYGNSFAEKCLAVVTDDTVTSMTYSDAVSDAVKFCVNEDIAILSYGSTSTAAQSSLEYHVGPGYTYSEIQDAIEDISGDYATIYVHPRSTPYSRFSLMRSLGDSYPWSGLAHVKHISIIGTDKAHCVVRDDSGNYDTPPAEIATNGIIANLQFISTHDDFDEEALYPSYAVHVDNRPADENGYHVIFDNCDLISYNTAAIGVGVYHNQTIELRNCLIASYADPNNFNPSYDYNIRMDIGSWFNHTAMNFTEGNEKFIFHNNRFISYNATKSCVIGENDSVPSLEVEAIGNTFWAYGANSYGFSMSETAAKSKLNHGNNVAVLNQA